MASEYQKTMSNATGDSMPHSGFKNVAAAMKMSDDRNTKSVASRRLIAPDGISRADVRGLRASIRASTRRLKPIAADRAATIATMTQKTCDQRNGASRHASSAPVSANGSAKTEWLKRTNDR